ncbi:MULTISPECIES: hypothetical protein [Amycolatopsis]|uniref:Uncharacterized protein n=2 Tax=Amycolatopsis TaxID=1813 RepID=A0A2A9FF27_9PSEU|nr:MULTISPECIES: hypothetical protein [Amycolatopsis]PFG49768.1 hypothetical protein ATK36_4945 [Amycolatopsis sulphurea]RJQ87412.1 hypothetical protein D5S19_09215 [Amycolatopsis panacis]
MPSRNPLHLLRTCADWFENRGVYVPGEESRAVDPVRDFGWLIVAWGGGVAVFILLFAFAV